MQEELIHKLSGYGRATFISKTQKKYIIKLGTLEANHCPSLMIRVADFSPNEAIVILLKDIRKKCNAPKETI